MKKILIALFVCSTVLIGCKKEDPATASADADLIGHWELTVTDYIYDLVFTSNDMWRVDRFNFNGAWNENWGGNYGLCGEGCVTLSTSHNSYPGFNIYDYVVDGNTLTISDCSEPLWIGDWTKQ